ncbi:MAG: hypothetical protein ACP5I4_10475 [Oceanipulchritudo sp.]
MKQSREGHPVVQWGIFHVVAQEDGRHFLHVPLPKDIDETLEFEPLKYFPKTVDEYGAEFRASYQRMLDYTGFVAKVGGGLTHQIPVGHLEYFLDLRKRLCDLDIEVAARRQTP